LTEQLSPVERTTAFDGETYEPEADFLRLAKQWRAVFDVMRDGRWRTLAEIRALVPTASESAISARLRDCRKERFGAHRVDKRRRFAARRGVFEYCLTVSQ